MGLERITKSAHIIDPDKQLGLMLSIMPDLWRNEAVIESLGHFGAKCGGT